MTDRDDIRKRRGIFYGWYIVAGCFVLLFLMAGAGFYSFSIFIRPLEETFGWSRASISLTMSIYFILSGLTGPLVGKWIQIHGPKKPMTVSALAFGACFVLISFTHSLWYFYAVYALLAFAQAGMALIPVSSVLSRWFVRRRGTAMGISMVGIAAGGLIMAPTVGLINGWLGWRAAFVFLGILAWGLGLPISLFLIKGSPAEMGLLPDGDRSDTEQDAPTSSNGPSPPTLAEQEGWPLGASLKTRAFIWTAVSFFLAPMAQMGVLQHQVPLVHEAGISFGASATAMGLTAGMGGLGKLSFGRISELLPVKYAAMLCFSIQAMAVVILLLSANQTMVWIYVLMFGFAMGGVVVLMPLVVGHFFGLASFSVILGVVALIQAVGSSLGAYASGLIYDTLGSYHYALIIYVAVYLTATVTIFLTGTPKTYQEA